MRSAFVGAYQARYEGTILCRVLHPAPAVGGQVIRPGAQSMGSHDQRAVDERDDVLVYSRAVLQSAVEVTGPIELRRFLASSARNPGFTGKLVDVCPDGPAIILTEGILRARYCISLAAPELLQPDTVYGLRLNLWATATVFCAVTASGGKAQAAPPPALTATATAAA